MSNQSNNKNTKLEEIFEIAKHTGTMTYDEIINKLSTTEIEPDQFDVIIVDEAHHALLWRGWASK